MRMSQYSFRHSSCILELCETKSEVLDSSRWKPYFISMYIFHDGENSERFFHSAIQSGHDVSCFIFRKVLSSNPKWNRLFWTFFLNKTLFHYSSSFLTSHFWYIVHDLSLARDKLFVWWRNFLSLRIAKVYFCIKIFLYKSLCITIYVITVR